MDGSGSKVPVYKNLLLVLIKEKLELSHKSVKCNIINNVIEHGYESERQRNELNPLRDRRELPRTIGVAGLPSGRQKRLGAGYPQGYLVSMCYCDVIVWYKW